MNVNLSCHGKDYPFIKACLQKIKDSSYELNEDQFLKDLQPLYNYQHDKQEKEEVELTQLKRFINSLSQEDKKFFLKELIPYIAGLALMESLVWPINGPKYLLENNKEEVILTKKETSIILANMFLLSTPRRYEERKNDLPDPCTKVCFDYIFYLPGFGKAKMTKLYCMLSYFKRMYVSREHEEYQNLRVTIQRLQFDKSLLNQSQNFVLGDIEINQDKKIEEFSDIECIQTDFANEYIGGKVLIDGNVQEEIQFSICPEMLVSLLICQKMSKTEAILIIGAEQFCSYSGYGTSFTYTGDYFDKRPIDLLHKRIKTCTTCIDAIHLIVPPEIRGQYQQQNVIRELVKSLTGFQGCFEEKQDDNKIPVVTGNWGCGVFNGDVHLKLLIQWIACSILKRKIIYCTFQQVRLKDEIDFIQSLKGKKISYILILIEKYSSTQKTESLFSFIKKQKQDQL